VAAARKLELARNQAEYTVLRASTSGVVTNLRIEVMRQFTQAEEEMRFDLIIQLPMNRLLGNARGMAANRGVAVAHRDVNEFREPPGIERRQGVQPLPLDFPDRTGASAAGSTRQQLTRATPRSQRGRFAGEFRDSGTAGIGDGALRDGFAALRYDKCGPCRARTSSFANHSGVIQRMFNHGGISTTHSAPSGGHGLHGAKPVIGGGRLLFCSSMRAAKLVPSGSTNRVTGYARARDARCRRILRDRSSR
jgi:hypothetical protein